MEATFTILGTGGWIPTPRRQTTCAILSLPEALFIFDAGTGIARLLEDRFRPELEAERPVHLFLSHYHLDHIIGLMYLPGLFKGRTVHLHPPASGITGCDPLETVSAIIRKPFNPYALEDMPVEVLVEPLEEGESAVEGLKVAARRQIHADPSVGFRIEDALVFATDTAADPGTAGFAAGAGTLVHEAWIDGAEEEDPATEHIAREAYVAHTSARQAAQLAAEAGAGQLVLSHLNPLRSDSYHEAMLASAVKIFPQTRILEDGETIEPG